jgi:CRP/FNR family cyclic AMP-dependent transcriptional regulator
MAMQQNLTPFLNLDESVLKELIPQGMVRTYPKGSIIIHAGDLSDSLYVILSGRVKVFISDENGKEFMLSTISPGDYFGEVALDGGPRTASIMTQDACRFFVIPKAEVKALIEHHPDFARDLIGRLISKIRNLADSVHNLALLSVYCRLLKFIEEQATRREDGRLATERVTQQEIAARIGASREMVSRIITDLTNCGYISVENRRIIVHKALPEH